MHPILIEIGAFRVPTYGVLVALGYLTGILWLKKRISVMPGMDEDKFWTLIYAVFFGAIVGGKILFILVEWRAFRSGEISLLRDFRYGFVFFGGLIGTFIAGYIMSRRLKFPFLANGDYFGVALPLGHAIGRLGCLAAGCCYGKPTTLPWAVRLGGSLDSSTPRALWGIGLHPTQLYESAANLMIAGFLWRFALPRVQKGKWAPGSVFFLYIALYALARFLIEFVRGDDRGWFFGGLWVSQWIALAALALSLGCLARRRAA